MLEYSASALSTKILCFRKWAYRYIDGIESPANKAAALGTEVHRQLEEWLVKKQVPSSVHAKRLLPLLPNPTHPDLRVEWSFRLLTPPGAARGFIDLLIPTPDPRLMPDPNGPAWSEEIPVVIDHKTTGNLFYAKTETDLLTDPQAILYGLAARVEVARERSTKIGNIPDVDLRWNYVQTRSPAETRPVRVRQSLQVLEDGLAPLLDHAREMGGALANGKSEDVDYDLRGCEAFGGCPYKDRCSAHQAYVAGSAPRPAEPSAYAPAMPDSALLAKLRGAKAPAPVQYPTPEPALQSPDTSGLDVPLVPGSSPIVPPDAPPNVTPEDPPVPVATAMEAKPKRGRKAAAAAPPPAGSEAEALEKMAQGALDRGEYALAGLLFQARGMI